MSRSKKKAFIKEKWSGMQPPERRHRRERVRVREAISRYGEEADLHLEPENFYEGERRFIVCNNTLNAAVNRAKVVIRVLDVMNKYVPLNSNSFEFECKHSNSYWNTKGVDEQLNLWLPIAQPTDFRQAESDIGHPIPQPRRYPKLLEGNWSWHDWMKDPERLYRAKYERK